MERIRSIPAALIVGLVVLAGRAYAEEDFVRGDTNRDGVVDAIDGENIYTYATGDGTCWIDVPCTDAFDFDDDGRVDRSDADHLWSWWSRGDGTLPSAPSGSGGRDPTVDVLDCMWALSYPPIEEPTMIVGVDGGTVTGDTQGHLATTLWITSDVPVNAVQLRLRLEGCPQATFKVTDGRRNDMGGGVWLGADGRSVVVRSIADGYWSGWLTMENPSMVGERFVFASLVVCLPEGTPAGSYRLCLDDVRVGRSGDLNAHIPQTQEGIIEVAATVAAASCPEPEGPPRFTCWSPSPLGCGGFVEFWLDGPSALTAQDDRFTVAVLVKSSAPPMQGDMAVLESLDVALDFNEYLFRVAGIEKTFAPEGVEPTRFDTIVGPAGCATTVNDRAEGYCALHVELGPWPDGVAWDSTAFYEVARITFEIWNPIANLYGDTLLRFRDVGEHGELINHAVNGFGREHGNGAYAWLAMQDFVIALPGAEPPIVATPEEAEVTFRLSEASGRPGASGVAVYAYIDSNTAIRAFDMWLTFDASILEFESAIPLAHISGQDPYYQFGEEWISAVPDGSRGACVGCGFYPLVVGIEGEHYIHSRYVFYYPAPGEPVACLRFRIREDALPGAVAEVAFVNLDESKQRDCSVRLPRGNVSPDTEPAEVRVTRLYSGKVLVDLETTIFLRGDSNDDSVVNIADAIWTLAFLFRHGTPPACLDAADANDDGLLDIADPIVLLTTLFTSNKCVAPPYPLRGTDLTPAAWAPCVQ